MAAHVVTHELFGVDELAPGQMRSVDIDGIAVLVCRLPDGGYRALRDVCPHLGVKLSRGTLMPVINSDDERRYFVSDVIAARCSWHGYEYDVDTGRCVADARWRVKTYPVRIENGTVVLERSRRSAK